MSNLIETSRITMSSREIAELTRKRHSHVLRDIRSMMEKLAASPDLDYQINQSLTAEYCEQTGRTTIYHLDKDATLTLLLGYDVVARMKVVKRWQELEAQQKPKLPQTYAEALLEAGRLALEVEEKTKQLEQAAPKVEFVDRYVQAEGSQSFRQVCKTLGAKENEFREFLLNSRIMYRLAGALTPYAQHLDTGRFTVLQVIDNSGCARSQAKFTPKGVEWVAGEWLNTS